MLRMRDFGFRCLVLLTLFFSLFRLLFCFAFACKLCCCFRTSLLEGCAVLRKEDFGQLVPLGFDVAICRPAAYLRHRL